MIDPLPPPLIVSGPAPRVIPVAPLAFDRREGRGLFAATRTILLRGEDGKWDRIPRGYVTDFGSIPGFATLLTLLMLQPLGRHAWAALGHDWRYAIGEPGQREAADAAFLYRMKLDGVGGLQRGLMYRAVQLGGEGGYRRAKTWWDTENFADPETGQYPVIPPFAREDAFAGQRWGRRDEPSWSARPDEF